MPILFLLLLPVLCTPAAIFAQPVVINEIAWMGTAAGYADEWIELYNPSSDTVDLDGWRLQAVDGVPTIALSGLLPPTAYFLLERSDDHTLSDLPANQIYTGDLSNSGEHLRLLRPDGGVADAVDCAAGWFAGRNAPIKYSMERIDPQAPGSVDSSWADHAGAPRNGLDAAGAPINGTPACRNSVRRSTRVGAATGMAPPGGALTGFPNPFAGRTTIRLPAAPGWFYIHDLRGRRVLTRWTTGTTMIWDGRDDGGGCSGPGLYVGQYISAGGIRQRLRLLKID